MVENIFCDGVSQIHFAGNMVRFDLISIVPNANNPEQPTTEVINRLVMNPRAFVATYKSMQQLIEKLIENKILTQGPDQPGETIKVDKVKAE